MCNRLCKLSQSFRLLWCLPRFTFFPIELCNQALRWSTKGVCRAVGLGQNVGLQLGNLSCNFWKPSIRNRNVLDNRKGKSSSNFANRWETAATAGAVQRYIQAVVAARRRHCDGVTVLSVCSSYYTVWSTDVICLADINLNLDAACARKQACKHFAVCPCSGYS